LFRGETFRAGPDPRLHAVIAQQRSSVTVALKPSPSGAEAAGVIERLRVRPDPERPVEVQVMGPGFIDVLHARDVSASGLGIFVPHGFVGCDVKQGVDLIVKLPDRPSFRASGVLRHRTTEGLRSFFGVELTRISDRARQAIVDYVEHRRRSGAETTLPDSRARRAS
jgi:hypothetical protein